MAGRTFSQKLRDHIRQAEKAKKDKKYEKDKKPGGAVGRGRV